MIETVKDPAEDEITDSDLVIIERNAMKYVMGTITGIIRESQNKNVGDGMTYLQVTDNDIFDRGFEGFAFELQII